jgi:hypothetical protein
LKDDDKEASKPSYFGYLSGVMSTLLNPAQKVIEMGQEVVQNVPLIDVT